ncbi:MAG: DUF6786 family protein [Paludibacteraceae bacterium]
MKNDFEKGSFGYDLNYLSQKDSLFVLKSDKGEAQVIVSAKYQAKVFTSTATGFKGKSLGFINYKFFEAGVVDEHMNGFGGENRFWLGPEGGQYSIFFEPGVEQNIDNWHTPKPVDIEKWEISSASDKEVVLTKNMELKNYMGNLLKIAVDRKISLIPDAQISVDIGMVLPGNVKTVAYVTNNKITNKNDFEWTPKTGTVCIWMLDMFNPSDSAVTVVPYNEGDEKQIGKIATTNYFGEIPAERIKMDKGILYFRTDGKFRSKIGMTSKRTKSVAGNYDPISKRLTIITFEVDKEKQYLNQEWNPNKDPLIGDALNAYNDGPMADGSIMGPFLELESSSPAAFLKPNESQSHIHKVYHFVGDEAGLSAIAEKMLGVKLSEVKKVF